MNAVPPQFMALGADPPYPQRIMRGLLSYWPLTEASGSRADIWGGQTLTDNATVTAGTAATGWLRTSSLFTAANSEWLSLADNTAMSVNGGSFTFGCWVNPTALGAQMCIASKYQSTGATTGEWIFRFNATGGVFATMISGSTLTSGVTTTTKLVAGQWSYVACGMNMVDGFQFVYNMGEYQKLTYSSAVNDSTIDFRIGQRSDIEFLGGMVAGAAYWQRALTVGELDWICNKGNGRAWFVR